MDKETNTKGDNDPIDIVEIGSKIHKRGDVVQVRVSFFLQLPTVDGRSSFEIIAIV